MRQKKTAGVYQLENGNWGYRFVLNSGGERISRRRIKGDDGKPFKTQKQAEKARSAELEKARIEILYPEPEGKVRRRRLKTVYKEYCSNGREGKAYTTIKRQDALWNNHILRRFGIRFTDDISPGEVQDYLAELYYEKGYSYGYVEGFLKQFYLIFGYSYARNYISVYGYNRMCENRATKIKMPDRKTAKKQEIKAYSEEEFLALDDYFGQTNVETAYMIGKYTGVRVAECYGITWDRVNLEEGFIVIDRQFQTQNGIAKLVPLKTVNAYRKLYINDVLRKYLSELKMKTEKYESEFGEQRKYNERHISDEAFGEQVSSLQLINTLPNGKIQTEHAIRHHAPSIREKYSIDFKYHNLRHTYVTKLAMHNTPEYMLLDQIGHGRSSTTHRYYLTMSKEGIDILRENLEKL